MKTISIVNNDYSFMQLARALAAAGTGDSFPEQLRDFVGARQCVFTSCGFAALYLLLLARKRQYPDRTEVILPAYTAPALVLPVLKAGLTPVLCDVSPRGFLVDHKQILNRCGARTLAVVAVHMFGLPCDVPAITGALDKDILVIEDCAQALGTTLNGKKLGSLAPVSFGSFSRGKNFSLYYGGFLAFNSDAPQLPSLPRDTSLSAAKSLCKMLAFSLVSAPVLYTGTRPVLGLMKSRKERMHFVDHLMARAAEPAAGALFTLWKTAYERRIANGRFLIDALQKLSGVSIPEYPVDARIAFNRFPLIVHDTRKRVQLFEQLNRSGIEPSFMYGKPVHHIFPLLSGDGFPEAEYLAEHLLTVPVHGRIGEKELAKTAGIFYSILK